MHSVRYWATKAEASKAQVPMELEMQAKKLWQSWPLDARNVHTKSVHCAASRRPLGLTNYELRICESSQLLQGSRKQKACLCDTVSCRF
jgi:hypothetical protein